MTSICSTRKSRRIRRQSLAEFHKIVALELVARPCPSFALATSRQQVSNLIIPGAIGMNGARPHCLSHYRDDEFEVALTQFGRTEGRPEISR
jgi:hypothetical protein